MSAELHMNHLQTAAPSGKTLFELAEDLGIAVPTSCRKQGKCKECLVEVVGGMEFLSPRTPAEKHLHDRFRLSCCTAVTSPSGVIRCHTLRRGTMRVENRAFELPTHRRLELSPAVKRDGDRILMDDREVGRGKGPLHGLALDLGTTTVVLRLLNLETAELVAESSFENPQRFGGSDVMSRIHFDGEDGTGLLQRTLAGYLARAIQEFPVDPATIYEMVVAGNSTMRDLFFRLDVQPIGQSPFQSVTEQEVFAGKRTTTSLSEMARRLHLPMHPDARVYGLPIITGHVGADTAACMLAVDIANEERLVAIMDIGTNTEIVLGNRHRLMAASCPAGPAFEGGRISCGMPGLPGAIERVRFRDDGSLDMQVIGATQAEGICGSGLVDLLGELVRTQRINPLGRFENGDRQLVLTQSGDGPVFLSESDINELAQAKAAHSAGLHILFDSYGARFEDVSVFYLAGGFGRYLDLDNARRIGLIPLLENGRIRQIGNASIEGACIALLSAPQRTEMENLVKGAVHCRLETHPHFFDFFVEGCQFAPTANPKRGPSGGTM